MKPAHKIIILIATVVLILAGAVAALIGLSSHTRQKALAVMCNATMLGFNSGMQSYQTMYSHFPAEVMAPKGPDSWQRTRGAVLKALMGDNPSKIVLFRPYMSENPAIPLGLHQDEHQEPVLMDAWGEPFYFIANPTGERKVPNPDPRDNKEHPFIDKPVISFSAGPDHDPNTWDDNVLSWK